MFALEGRQSVIFFRKNGGATTPWPLAFLRLYLWMTFMTATAPSFLSNVTIFALAQVRMTGGATEDCRCRWLCAEGKSLHVAAIGGSLWDWFYLHL